MKTIMLGAAMVASLAALSLAAAPAIAEERERVAITVSAAGYDLTRPADVARLRDKIDLQIRKACEVQQTGTRIRSRDEQRCREQMLASAAQQIDRQVQLAAQRARKANRG